MLRNNTQDSRYEFTDNGQVVALVEYRREGNAIVFTHTKTLPEKKGRGYASKLAQEALNDVRRQQLNVIPVCSFIANFIEENPQYRSLIA